MDRDDIASVSVNLESANYSSETRTLNAKLPALPYVESQITTVNAVLELAGKSIKMVLKLNKPFNLPPLLAEILKQYSRLGSALINPDFPPSVQWLKTDICGDKHLAQTTFLPCARNDDRTCLVEVGRIDGYRMATANGWIFVAKDSAGEFPFETVGPSHVTFLGDKYELNYLGATKEKDALKASFDVGDFSGCFGAGCGEPSNLREVYVTLKKGVMSTKFGPKK